MTWTHIMAMQAASEHSAARPRFMWPRMALRHGGIGAGLEARRSGRSRRRQPGRRYKLAAESWDDRRHGAPPSI
jgi:hypothetical protein